MTSTASDVILSNKTEKETDAKKAARYKGLNKSSLKAKRIGKSKSKAYKVKSTSPFVKEHCLGDPTMDFENQNLPQLYPELSDSLLLNPMEQEKLEELAAREFENNETENSSSLDDMQCVPGTVERASEKSIKKKPRFKLTPTRQELKEKKNKVETEDNDAIREDDNNIKKADTMDNSQTSDDGSKSKRKSKLPKKVKKEPKFEMTKKSSSSFLERKVGSWAQCCREECGKWRFLHEMVDPNDIPDRWVCSMNKDADYADCDASQEAYDSQDSEVDVIYSPYPPGAIVWAKIAGYPWWPAMMQNDPDYGYYYEKEEKSRVPISYHVVFFGKDVSRAWVSKICVRNFTGAEELEDMGQVTIRKKSYKKQLENASREARNALKLSLEERLQCYGFEKRYRGPIGSPEDTQVGEDNRELESSSGASQELASSSESSYNGQEEKKTQVNKITKKKPVKRPTLSKTQNKAQQKSSSIDIKVLSDGTGKTSENKAKVKNASSAPTEASDYKEETEIKTEENDGQTVMEEQINHANSQANTFDVKAEMLSTETSINQTCAKEKIELLFTKEMSNSAEEYANKIIPSANEKKGKRGSDSESRTKPIPRKRQHSKVKPVDGNKAKERRKPPLKKPKNKTQVADGVSDNNGNLIQAEEMGSPVVAAGLRENKPKNDSSTNKNSNSKMIRSDVPVKTMPKLIKPSFNPPSLKINNQHAPRKMPKLVKPRFVSPACNKLSDNKEKGESIREQSRLTVRTEGVKESSEGCSDLKRKRKDDDSQIVFKRKKNKTRKIIDSDEDENECKNTENRDDIDFEISQLVQKITEEQGDLDIGSDDDDAGISEERFVSFMPEDDTVQVQLVSDDLTSTRQIAVNSEEKQENSPEF